MDVTTVLYAIIAALIYGLTFYIHNRQLGEAFDPAKLLATLIVALFIGIVMAVTGNPITEFDIWAQLIAYAGLVAVIETWIKILLGLGKPKAKRRR